MGEYVYTEDTNDPADQSRLEDEYKNHLRNCEAGLKQILGTPTSRIWLCQLLRDLGFNGVQPNFAHDNVGELFFYQSGMRGAADKIALSCREANPGGWLSLQSESLELDRTFGPTLDEPPKRKRGRRGGKRAKGREEVRPDDD